MRAIRSGWHPRSAAVFASLDTSLQVSGDAATRSNMLLPTGSGSATVGFYVRSKDVTAQVRAAGAGEYSVKKVPAVISDPSSLSADTSHAGWTLAVVYEDVSAPLRSLTLWCGSTAVSLAAGSTDVSVSGFLTPDALPVSGKIFVSAQEGDAVIGAFFAVSACSASPDGFTAPPHILSTVTGENAAPPAAFTALSKSGR